METIKLNNNNEIPLIGLGTYRNNNYKDIFDAVKTAFDNGIRLIDTAEIYGNEAEIGKAMKELNIRDKIFLTTKVWNSETNHDALLRSFEKSLKKLQTDYIDLYLIHWPGAGGFIETWKAMENLYKQGVIKNIGVSNFHESHITELLDKCEIVPAVNQIELHPYFQQKRLTEFCRKSAIAVEAWSPLAKGRVANDSLLAKIGKKYGKTPVQVTLRWQIQHDIITIPKSSNPKRIIEFAGIYDFELSETEMRAISQLDISNRIGPNPDNFIL